MKMGPVKVRARIEGKLQQSKVYSAKKEHKSVMEGADVQA